LSVTTGLEAVDLTLPTDESRSSLGIADSAALISSNDADVLVDIAAIDSFVRD